MGRKRATLPSVRPKCSKIFCSKLAKKRSSGRSYSKYCCSCEEKKYRSEKSKQRNYKSTELRKRPYIQYKKNRCSECGFIPKHSCQLDVHHIDKDHFNNDPENLKTLCANCHRLEHIKQSPVKGH